MAATFTARVELVDSRQPGVRKLRDYSGVVVWLEPVGSPASLPAPRDYTMAQKGKQFRPHVLAIPVGATVDFPNFDPIFHNAFSNFAGQPFDTGLYPPGTTRKVRFQRPGVVQVFCNIHSTMSAAIVVLNTPYFAVSAPDGAVRFEGVPPGAYRLRVWHERALEATLKAIERTVEISSRASEPVALRLSEAGYIASPHTNKYGREYPPEPGGAAYPGARE
jgi:hypothetical protein